MTRQTIAIVSHDAGGAEILASFCAASGESFLFVLEGPAVRVFERRFVSLKISQLESAIDQCDWVLCGTSWQSDLEWRAIRFARLRKKRVVAFLDHWINYHDRFDRKGHIELPDELWVGDPDAERIARNTFPCSRIRLKENPYLASLRANILQAQTGLGRRESDRSIVLFVSENISGHAQLQYGDPYYSGYTEFEAIDYLVKNMKAVTSNRVSIVVRPHPSDLKGKYDRLVVQYSGLVQVSDTQPLLEDIARADIVVGCQSMALVVALEVGKRVISCVPPGGFPCKLPQDGIEMMQSLVSARAARV